MEVEVTAVRVYSHLKTTVVGVCVSANGVRNLVRNHWHLICSGFILQQSDHPRSTFSSVKIYLDKIKALSLSQSSGLNSIAAVGSS